MPMGSLTNLLAWHTGTYCGGIGTRTAQFCAVSFDFAVQEILQALVAGKTLVLPEERTRLDAYELAAWIARYGINELFAPALVIDAVLAAAADTGERLDSLTDLFQGGEQFRLGDDLRAFCSTGWRRMAYNVYGPAEVAAITSSTLPEDIDEWPGSAPSANPSGTPPSTSSTSGSARRPRRPRRAVHRRRPDGPRLPGPARPHGGTVRRLAVRTARLPDVPHRRHRPLERHREAGVPRPLRPPDQDRRLPRRTRRGRGRPLRAPRRRHRRRPRPRGRPRHRAPRRLRRARRPPAPPADADLGRALRGYIAEHLPPTWCRPPSSSCPNSPHREREARPGRTPSPAVTGDTAGEGPRTDREKTLCALFADVLGVADVGIDDGFFDLGGDSIMSIQLVARARRAGLALTVRDVFEHRTVAALAPVVTESAGVAAEEPGAALGEVPHTPINHWLLARTDDLDAFHMSAVLQAPAGLDPDHLNRALQALLDHHDALRARLTPGPDRRMEIPEPGTVDAAGAVRHVDATGLTGTSSPRSCASRARPPATGSTSPRDASSRPSGSTAGPTPRTAPPRRPPPCRRRSLLADPRPRPRRGPRGRRRRTHPRTPGRRHLPAPLGTAPHRGGRQTRLDRRRRLVADRPAHPRPARRPTGPRPRPGHPRHLGTRRDGPARRPHRGRPHPGPRRVPRRGQRRPAHRLHPGLDALARRRQTPPRPGGPRPRGTPGGRRRPVPYGRLVHQPLPRAPGHRTRRPRRRLRRRTRRRHRPQDGQGTAQGRPRQGHGLRTRPPPQP